MSVRLDSVCDIIMGQAPAGDEYNDQGLGMPLLAGAGDFKNGRPVAKKFTRVVTKECVAGDLVIGIRASIGDKVVADRPYCLGRGVAVIRPKKNDMVPRYLWHWMTAVRPELERKAKGATFKQVNRADIGELELELPAPDEQQRIAAILDKAEELRAKRRAAIALLDQLPQAIFLEMFGDPVKNPQGREIVPIGQVADCIVPGRDKPKSFTGEIPWITTSDLVSLGRTGSAQSKRGLTVSECEAVRARIIPRGSVVLSCVGDLGLLSIADCPMVINQQLHSFQVRENWQPEFLMYALSFQTAFMYSKASSTTLPYMNKSVCNSIPVPTASEKLQVEFSTRINALHSIKAAHESALYELDSLFATLQTISFLGGS